MSSVYVMLVAISTITNTSVDAIVFNSLEKCNKNLLYVKEQLKKQGNVEVVCLKREVYKGE